MNALDMQILNTLLESTEGLTAYAIAKITGIPQTNVIYRLNSLVANGVVTANVVKGIKYVYIHKIFCDSKQLKAMANHLQAICEIIEKDAPITEDGIKTIIDFIISRTTVVPPKEQQTPK